MDTVLCNKGYIINKNKFPENLIKNVKKELTMKPFIPGSRSRFAQSFKLYEENEEKLCIPKCYGINKFGNPNLTDFTKPKSIKLKFNGDLRDYQIAVIKDVIPKIKNQEGGTISLPPGRGKTVIACKLISELKKKTLVVVHKTFLLNQWKKRIEQFLPNAKVGKIQGKEVDVEGKDIVMGMLQSLSLKDDYADDLFDDFGTIVFDECHHVSAEQFSQILRKITTRQMIGLSGTPFRNDKLEKVFEHYIGKIIYYEKPQVNQEILVKIYKFDMKHDRYVTVINKYTKEAQLPTMISNLAELVERNEFITNLINECRSEKSRKVLVLSDRLEHLDFLKERVEKLEIGTTSKYIGGMKQDKLDEAEEADIIFSTYSMSSEALDIATLNTVILSTSRRNVEQSVGRILRKQKGNYIVQPLVIDIVDNLKPMINQSYGRKSYYKKITSFENIENYQYKDGEIEYIESKKPVEVEQSLFDSDSDSN